MQIHKCVIYKVTSKYVWLDFILSPCYSLILIDVYLLYG